jgi:hypothetical protein
VVAVKVTFWAVSVEIDTETFDGGPGTVVTASVAEAAEVPTLLVAVIVNE